MTSLHLYNIIHHQIWIIIYESDDNEVWITEKIDDDLTKYTFTITEKDLK
jgi:hypothetical protein